MNIDLNTLQGITFDGHDVQGLVYNGVTLWSKGGGSPTPSYDPYFTVECLGSGSIKLYRNGSLRNRTIYVWLNTIPNSDRSNYTSQATAKSGESLIVGSLHQGDIVRLYCADGENQFGSPSNNSYYYSFRFDMNVKLSGDISSLINYNTTLNKYAFNCLFDAQTTIVDISGLVFPWTTASSYCFYRMFRGCSGLTSVQNVILQATSTDEYSYSQMFYNCTGLTSVPAGMLPATGLGGNCYRYMFGNCTSLISAPDLLATTIGVSSYNQMFYNCFSLNSIKCLATTGTIGNTDNWVNGVASTGTFTKASGVTWNSGVSGIPSGWTVVEV